MKNLCAILLLVLLTACGERRTRDPALAEGEKATIIARNAANAHAQGHYQCQPFVGGPSAVWTNGQWFWRDRRGFGSVDFEAVVWLGADFSTQSVQVLLLDSRATMSLPLRSTPSPR